MGKVSQADFEEMASRLRSRAMSLMKQLDEDASGYKTIIERELGARLAGRTAAHAIDQPPEVEPPPAAVVAGLCTCGTSNDSDAIFCKRCGAKLTA